jgi:hypothetical protein
MLLVNLISGPGAGKSTTAAGLEHHLKMTGLDAEGIKEYAKDLVHRQDYATLQDQAHVFIKQLERQATKLKGNVEVAVTDSPLICSIIYGADRVGQEFRQVVMDAYQSFERINIVIERNKDVPFQTEGRIHTAQESDMITAQFKRLLDEMGEAYHVIQADEVSAERVYTLLAAEGLVRLPPEPVNEGDLRRKMSDRYISETLAFDDAKDLAAARETRNALDKEIGPRAVGATRALSL